EAHLLPLDGISHWPLARQQRDQSLTRSDYEDGRRTARPGLARIAGTGARRRAGKRWTRTPGSLLSRFHGDDATPGHGLRPALRIRHFQAGDPRWLAAGTAGQLADATGSMGSRAPARQG